MNSRIKLIVNDATHHLDVDAGKRLLNVLREDLDLTGSKYGCGEGQCGACTVLSDGIPIRSCIVPAGDVVGRRLTTIEGLETDGHLHPLQEAFLEVDALQCGYCTPGMIMAGVALLASNPSPTRQEVIAAMDANVCRCGTYPRIFTAISHAATMLQEGSQ